jgi:2-C-methyl-D-erythritol 4-phosphate cytidylyltransferase/2-C-methyl-D-erythritol 2,4-cyclodiphosphate synthase
MKNIWTILLAAGRGTRLAQETGGARKQFLTFHGAPLYWHSVRTFAAMPALSGMVVVFPEAEMDQAVKELDALKNACPPGLPVKATAGGERRQDSVRLGLAALPAACTHVFVHDSARPFFSARLLQELLTGLTDEVHGVIPAVPVTDTIKEYDGDLVRNTPDRARLAAAQTPQLFLTRTLKDAHARAVHENWTATDDASLIEQAGLPVRLVPGETRNKKITTPEDLRMLHESPAPPRPCTGFGYDVHAYGGDRPLVLGGIPIAGAPTVRAHSDGDVLLHAVCDAVLGCLGRGDIGEHFPDTDPRLDNIASGVLLSEIMDMARSAHLRIYHVDLTIIAQTPRLAPHKAAIRANVARLMELDDTQVNVKATTEERLGFTGRKEGIKAVAVVTGART